MSRKPGVSLEKEPGRTGMIGSGPPDLDLRVRIRWVLDLILHVGFRSDGRGDSWATAAAERAGTLCTAAARDGVHQSSPNPTLRGSNQVELWPGMVSAIRVNHLSTERGMEVCRAVLATAVAAQVVGKPPACCVRAVQTLENGCKGRVE